MRVQGEIAGLTRAASGHWYFSLRDPSASVKAVMFRGKTSLLSWQPQEGDQVEVTAVVTLYEPRGDFQLRIEAISRSGQGALFEAFLARKQKLLQAGLLDPERKRPIPTTINAIGLVTSLGAAALRDVVATLTQLAPRIRIVLYPSLVQGTEAAAMLCQQIRRADQNPALDA
jgi:exodeoxyribonuclease VII large subunit